MRHKRIFFGHMYIVRDNATVKIGMVARDILVHIAAVSAVIKISREKKRVQVPGPLTVFGM